MRGVQRLYPTGKKFEFEKKTGIGPGRLSVFNREGDTIAVWEPYAYTRVEVIEEPRTAMATGGTISPNHPVFSKKIKSGEAITVNISL